MSSFVFQTGATSKSIPVRAYDSTTFLPKPALVFNSAGLTAYYREGATGTPTAVTLATQTIGGAWASGGFVLADDTNMPGEYRLDLPDAALDGGAGTLVSIYLKATGVIFQPVDIVLTADDPTSAAATTAAIADAVHDEDLSDHTTAGSAGKALTDIETKAIAAADLTSVVEGSLTLKGVLRLALAALSGKSTGGGKTFRDVADAKNRIVATTDGSGNRTAVTLDVTD